MTLDGFVAPSCTRSWVCPCRAVFHIGFRLVHRSALVFRAGEVDPGHMRVHTTVDFSLLYTGPMLLMPCTYAVSFPFMKSIRVAFLLSGPPPYFSFFKPVHRLPVIPIHSLYFLNPQASNFVNNTSHLISKPTTPNYQNGFPSDARSSRRARLVRYCHSWSVGIWYGSSDPRQLRNHLKITVWLTR